MRVMRAGKASAAPRNSGSVSGSYANTTVHRQNLMRRMAKRGSTLMAVITARQMGGA